ncbi:signal recognition particle protein [Candidatus Pacearchaeota archaeon]|nr:signal recognition particle protein [Candidatus Pacearchaeota archaeon]
MLEKLSSALKKTTDKIANAVFLDKKQVDALVRDLQRALIEADVNVQLVLQITQKIKASALDERIKGIEKKEHLIKLLHDELTNILGKAKEIKLKKTQNRILLVGLYGAGKTTTIAKLAAYYQKRGHSVAAIGLDVHRPAAAEQLKQNCEKLNVPCFINPKEKNPKKIYESFKPDLKKYNLILIDTAGRDALDDDLVKEISTIDKTVKPTETILVMPADIGQTAKQQAQTFHEALDLSGVIITRMDSTAKAGGALTACAEAKVPVIFIGTGEKPADLETFNPEAFLSRMLGMGDLAALMEKVRSAIDPEQLEAQQERLAEGKMTLDDFSQQLDSLGEIGSFDKLMELVPGLGAAKEKMPEGQLEQQQEKTKRWKHAISSMTQEEKDNPELLEKQTSRIQRIAKGSGTTTTDIRALLKQFSMMQDLVKNQSQLASGQLDQKTMMKLAKKFGKKMRI